MPSAASSTLYVPITFTRIVRTGLASTVSTPAIAAQWTMWVAPTRRVADGGRVEHVALDQLEVGMRAEVGALEAVAVEVVEGDDGVRVEELAREGRADEPGAAGDEDPLAFQSHRAKRIVATTMDSTLAAWLAVSESSDDEFVDRLWRLVLRREVEPDVRDDARARLQGGMSRSALLQELATSPEFEHVRILDDSVAWAAAQRRGGARPRNLQAPPGTDERPIEIPWCLARCGPEARILDVGYAFAEPAYLAGLLGLGAAITGVDLVAVDVPGPRPRSRPTSAGCRSRAAPSTR